MPGYTTAMLLLLAATAVYTVDTDAHAASTAKAGAKRVHDAHPPPPLPTEGAAAPPTAQTVVAELRARLLSASAVLAAAAGVEGPVACTCASYCTGQCFAAACAPCTADTWSFPGGASLCFDPGPLGNGLLCQVAGPSTNRTTTKNACCTAGGAACALPAGSCCGSGSCRSCPSYPPPPTIFESLNRTRTFVDGTCRAV